MSAVVYDVLLSVMPNIENSPAVHSAEIILSTPVYAFAVIVAVPSPTAVI